MMRLKTLLRLATCVVAPLIVAGCASAYRDYRDCTHYNQCPPPPLPHEFYRGCPTPLAEQYPPAKETPPQAPLENTGDR